MKVMSLKFLLTSLVTLVWFSALGQATYTTSGSNNVWTSATSWTYVSGTPVGTVPASTDNVIITNGINITANTTINNITLNGIGNIGVLTNANVTLTVNGTLTMNGTSHISSSVANSTVALNGNVLIPAGQAPYFFQVNVTQAAAKNFTVNCSTFAGGTTGYTMTVGNLILSSATTWQPTGAVIVNATSLDLTDGSTIDCFNTTGGFILSGGITEHAGTAGSVSTLGSCLLTVGGSVSINGTLYISAGSGGATTKIFNGTITNNVHGEFRNTSGQNLVFNCSIVNNSLWAAPLANNGTYTVNGSGSYSYTGTNTIGMAQLSITGPATVTNQGLLALSGATGLTVNNAAASFINGNGGYLQLLATGTNVTLTSGTINFSTSSNEVDYDYAGTQNVYATTYDKLTASNTGTKSLTGTTTVNHILKTSSTAVLDDGANTMSGAGSITMSGTSQINFQTTGVNLPGLTGTSNSFASGTTIRLYGTAAAQTLKTSSTFPYQNVLVNGTAGCSANLSNVSNIAGNLTVASAAVITNNAVLTVAGTTTYSSTGSSTLANNLTTGSFLISNGTLIYSGLTITVNGTNGTWTTNGGTLTTNASSTVLFTTGAGQQIGGTSAPSFVNLTINNSNDVTLTANATVTTLLTLTAGRVLTGTNNLIVANTGTVSRTSGFVEGNLRKNVNTCVGCSINFEVGTSSTYAPLQLTAATVTVAGSLTVSTVASDDPYISSSLINSAKSVNRYWTLSNMGATLTAYKPQFTYAAADVDGAATPANFYYSMVDPSTTTWTAPLAPNGVPTSTGFLASASTANPPSGASRQFQVGEALVTSAATVINAVSGTPNWSSAATWIQYRTGTSITVTSGIAAVTGVSTLFTTELAVNDVIMFQTSPGTVIGTVQSITDNTHLTLASNATVTTTAAYGRQHVPISTDAVQIGNTNVNVATSVQLDAAGACYSLIINAQTNAQSLTHVGANALAVGSGVTIQNPSFSGINAWNINAGSAAVSTLTIGSLGASNARIAKVVTTSGTLTVSNNITFSPPNVASGELAAVMDMSGGSGTLNIGGAFSFTNSRGLLLPGTTSTVNFNGTSAQSIFPSSVTTTYPGSNGTTQWTFNNIYSNNTSGSGLTSSCALISGTNFSGDLRIQSGLFTTGSSNAGGFPGGNYNTNITGAAAKTFQISPGATFVYSSYSTLSGFGTNYDFGASTPFGTFNYATGQTTILTGYSYGNLIVNAGYCSLTATTYTIAGSLSILSGSTIQGPGSGSAIITVGRDLTIASGATTGFNINSTAISSISVGGNWVNSGSYNAWGSSAVIFTDAGVSQPQILSGTSAETFYNVQLNTAGSTNTVQLLKNMTVSNVLTLTQGGLNLNGFSLSVTNSSTSAIGSTSGYIMSETQSTPYAPVIWTTGNTTGIFVFPFGKNSTTSIPFKFNITNGGAPYNATLSVATYGTIPNNTPYPSGVTDMSSGGVDISANVVDRFWIITPNSYTTNPTATMTFTGAPGEVGTIVSLTVQEWSSGNFWNPVFPGQTNSTYSATVPGIFNFGIWTLSGNGVTLPIELVSFNASANEDKVVLNWSTASEINNDHFTIKRSGDGKNFMPLAVIKGSGTKNSPSQYSYIDNSPLFGRSYYQLTQTDFDGYSANAETISVEFQDVLEPQVYPNPFNGKQGFLLLPESWGETTITLFDMNGNKISQNNSKSISNPTQLQYDSGLPNGIYLLLVESSLKRKIIKIVIN